MRCVLFPVALLGGFFVAPLSAQIQYASQIREVSAATQGHAGNQTAFNSAPDFGAFDAQVATPPDSGGSASASQQSTLTPTTIHVSGSVSAVSPQASGNGSASAGSILEVVFTLADAEPFTLSGNMTALPDSTRAARTVTLVGPTTGVFRFDSGPVSGAAPPLVPFSADGILQPGTYHLDVTASGYNTDNGLTSNSGDARYSLSLTVPEPSGLAWVAGALLIGWRGKRTFQGR
jgi:hypothetical protein